MDVDLSSRALFSALNRKYLDGPLVLKHIDLKVIKNIIIQSILVNSKSSGLEVLFRIISSSKYRVVDMKIIITPKIIIIRFSLSIKHKFWVHKRNVSRRRFFYAPKTYIIIDSY